MPGERNRFVAGAAARLGARREPPVEAFEGIDVTDRVVYREGRAVSVDVFGRTICFEPDGERVRVGAAMFKLHRIKDREFLVEC